MPFADITDVADVSGFVNAITKTGYSGPSGIEMLSTDDRETRVATAARRAFASAAVYLQSYQRQGKRATRWPVFPVDV
ncbi:hypothetical protein [Mycolicibacterium sp.]|uniref:hypothetical protein n=1 Tax=Mycolicibacterium sp. TaxID=2320850 RepID=UPI0037C9749E